MPVRNRITYNELKIIYKQGGFLPLEGSPFSFVRESDNMMLFHCPIGDSNTDEFHWTLVLSEVDRTFKMFPEADNVHEDFISALVDLFTQDE